MLTKIMNLFRKKTVTVDELDMEILRTCQTHRT